MKFFLMKLTTSILILMNPYLTTVLDALEFDLTANDEGASSTESLNDTNDGMSDVEAVVAGPRHCTRGGRVWPSLVTKFGQDQVWPRPSLAKTKFGQVWPNVDRNILESKSTKLPKNEGKQEKSEKEGKQTISRNRKN